MARNDDVAIVAAFHQVHGTKIWCRMCHDLVETVKCFSLRVEDVVVVDGFEIHVLEHQAIHGVEFRFDCSITDEAVALSDGLFIGFE